MVALSKIETSVLDHTVNENSLSDRTDTNLYYIYSIADIFKNINTKDYQFLKYIPNMRRRSFAFAFCVKHREIRARLMIHHQRLAVLVNYLAVAKPTFKLLRFYYRVKLRLDIGISFSYTFYETVICFRNLRHGGL